MTGDALYAQRDSIRQVVKQGGSYLWVLKDNQPTVKEAVSLLFADPPWGEEFSKAAQRGRHEDRRERRQLRASAALNGCLEWPCLGQVCCMERTVYARGYSGGGPGRIWAENDGPGLGACFTFTAGVGGSTLEIDPTRWEQPMRVNVTGPYLCGPAVLPVMMEQRRGSIINIGSRIATDPAQGGGVLYSASKAAVHMFSLCLADEVRDYNIAVNILSPGALRSEGSEAIPWTQRDWHERVDPSAVYLALQDASTFTGQLAAHADFGTTWGPSIQSPIL